MNRARGIFSALLLLRRLLHEPAEQMLRGQTLAFLEKETQHHFNTRDVATSPEMLQRTILYSRLINSVASMVGPDVGTQGFVASYDAVDGPEQSPGIEGPTQQHGAAHVVGAVLG